MSTSARQTHWESIYTTKGETEVSWFQEVPDLSLELIALVEVTRRSAIIDIGGGASRLVDCLISAGYEDSTVLAVEAATESVLAQETGCPPQGRAVQHVAARVCAEGVDT